MKKIKCVNGHFFDQERFSSCPICGASAVVQQPVPKSDPVPLPHTQPLMPPNPDSKFGLQEFESTPLPAAARSNSLESRDAADVQTEPLTPATEPKARSTSLSEVVGMTASKSVSPLPKTMAYYGFDEVNPPVAWLVCVEGPYAGRAFECKTGRNRIGRDPGMDICLTEDPSVSRDTHAIITYEPKQRTFYLDPGTSSGLTYLNRDYIFDHKELHGYDKIELGKSTFLFLPFCGERFSWSDYIKEG